MLLIPAIDLKDGHCVRLEQGDMSVSTSFGDDPAVMARRWLDAGARRLHLVDLNGAFAGKPVNESAVKAIIKELGTEIPIARRRRPRPRHHRSYLDDGISYIIIGAAVKAGLLKDTAFGGHIKWAWMPRTARSPPTADGSRATGWSIALKFRFGVEGVIYRHRPRRHAHRHQRRRHRQARAGAHHPSSPPAAGRHRRHRGLCAVEEEGIRRRHLRPLDLHRRLTSRRPRRADELFTG